MTYDFTVSDRIPATPEQIYDAWLDGKGHQQLTGGKPATASAEVGARFTAHDGYISGRNIELQRPHRIVQSWRTRQFTAADPDSRIEVLLEPTAGGTKVTLHHSNVPDGHTGYQNGGWQKNYFDTMKQHFKTQA